jgi:hypothetical protein
MSNFETLYLCCFVLTILFVFYTRFIARASPGQLQTLKLDKTLYLSLEIARYTTQKLVNLPMTPQTELTTLTIESATFETIPIKKSSKGNNHYAERPVKVEGVFRDQHGRAVHSVMILFLISLNDMWQPATTGHSIKILGYNKGLPHGSPTTIMNPCYVEFKNPYLNIEPTFLDQKACERHASDYSLPPHLPFDLS